MGVPVQLSPIEAHERTIGQIFSDAYAKGTPLIYFVVHPSQKGRTNSKEIAEIEDFLIQAGVATNPNLQNVRGTQQPNWSIKGVIRSGAGKRKNAEAQFGSMFDIQRR